MRTACLVNFEHDENYLWENRYTAFCSLLKNYMSGNGIQTYVYFEKDITSVVDIAENITSFSDEICIFITSKDNIDLNLSLAKHIVEEESDCMIVMLCVEALDERKKQYINSEYICIYRDFAKKLGEILSIPEERQDFFSDQYSQFSNENDIVRFSEKPEIVIGMLEEQCISRNNEAVKHDIEKICSLEKDNLCIRCSGISLEQYSDVEVLLDCIRKSKDRAVFLVEVNMEYLITKGAILPDNLIFEVVIDKMEQLDSLSSLFELYKGRLIGIKMDSALIGDTEKVSKMLDISKDLSVNMLYGENEYWYELDREKIEPFIAGRSLNKEIQTLMNGLIFSHTGEYITIPLNGFVKHVKVHLNRLGEELYSFLEDACSVNSSILIEGEKTKSENNIYHVAGTNRVYEKLQWIEEIREESRKESFYPKNLISIDDTQVTINGLVNSIDVNYLEIPYSKFDEAEEAIGVKVFTVEQPEDFDAFVKEADEYFSNKAICNSTLLRGRMKNMCRFLSRNYCSLTKVPRIEIDEDGRIYPCYEKNITLGTIEDSLFDITQEAYVQHENTIRNNQCSKCPANIGCPKCVNIPEFLKKQYCSVMVNKPYISDFVIDSIVMSHLVHTNKIFAQMDLSKVKISNEYMQNILTAYEDGTEAPFFSKYVFIIQADSFFGIWSPVTNRTYRISKEIAIIGEGLLKKIEPSKIMKIIEEITGLPNEQASQLCRSTFDLFYKNNLLYRPVTF